MSGNNTTIKQLFYVIVCLMKFDQSAYSYFMWHKELNFTTPSFVLCFLELYFTWKVVVTTNFVTLVVNKHFGSYQPHPLSRHPHPQYTDTINKNIATYYIYIKRFVREVWDVRCHVLFVPGGQTICLSPGGQTFLHSWLIWSKHIYNVWTEEIFKWMNQRKRKEQLK